MTETATVEGPRVTANAVEDAVLSEVYCTGSDAWRSDPRAVHDFASTKALGLLTICILVLKNGFTVVGHSACAAPENFDAETGRGLARAHAVRQIWPLLGYALRDRLHHEAKAAPEVTEARDV